MRSIHEVLCPRWTVAERNPHFRALRSVYCRSERLTAQRTMAFWCLLQSNIKEDRNGRHAAQCESERIGIAAHRKSWADCGRAVEVGKADRDERRLRERLGLAHLCCCRPP